MKIRDILTIAILIAILAGLKWFFPEPADAPEVIEGYSQIIDGDSLRVDGYEVRLVGIDAPEGRQMCQRGGSDWACGKQSAARLRAIIGSEKVKCRVEKRDQYRRLLAICHVGRKNLNQMQVENGWAVSYGRFKREERKARDTRRGIWSGTFERPKEWRNKNM